MSEGQLQGRTAIVTGAGTGIGEAIARRYAAEGANVVITGRRVELLQHVADEVTATGGAMTPVRADVGDEQSVDALFEKTVDSYGTVDILVNNAGIAGPIANIWELELKGWEETLHSNLTGPWLCARAAARIMIPKRQGKIINIGSISGKRPLATRTPYVSTKLGLVGLTRTLAFELGDYNINVNHISPGLVNTPRIEELAKGWNKTPDQVREELSKPAALKRISEPEDIANLAVFLATELSRNITGFDINVDAGLFLSDTMPGRLEGQVAIVTGGSRGIGMAIGRAFAREGATLVVAARQHAGVEAAAQELRGAGAEAEAVVVDVTDPATVERMVRTTLDRFGRLDILVNNAGAHKAARFQDYTLADWKHVVEVNLHGTFICTQAVLPAMIGAGHGKIVNIASTAAKWGSLYQSAYNASKHAVLGLTRCLALETAQQGINVNAICPGFVETEMADALLADFGAIMGRSAEETAALLKARVPQGRFLRPEEVADLAIYLASRESDAMTGVGVTLAGGMVLI